MEFIDRLPEQTIRLLAKMVIALSLLLAISLVAAFSGCATPPPLDPSVCQLIGAHDPVRADRVCGGLR